MLQNFFAYVNIVLKRGDDMAFKDKLKELMAERGLRAVDLARGTGLSEAAISDYLKGKKEPRGRQSVLIAKVLNVSLDVLWETGFGEPTETEILKPNSVQNFVLQYDENGRPVFSTAIFDYLDKLNTQNVIKGTILGKEGTKQDVRIISEQKGEMYDKILKALKELDNE